jgi:antitoxin ParD1/3/4
MNITLTSRHRKYIVQKVKSGAYGSATEVVREGLRLLEAQEDRLRRIAWLEQEIERGFSGPATSWEANDSDRIRKLIKERVPKA